MIGSLIGGGLGVVGSIFGGLKASQAMKKYRNSVLQQKKANEDWFNRSYNEDATQRADAQRAYTKLNDDLKARSRAAAGQQAVMGGTDEGVAATKAANAQALADTASQIAADGARRKDEIESRYQQRRDDLDNQLGQIEVGRAQNIAEATKGVAAAGGSIAAGLDSTSGGVGKAKANGQTITLSDGTVISNRLGRVSENYTNV